MLARLPGAAALREPFTSRRHGRDLPEIPGRYENASTDVPLLAYHTSSVDPATGYRTIEYTTIWSNEDGGTNTPALMARWGRTTDIEWIYRVVVDARGRRVSDAYQAANHETKAFDGLREALFAEVKKATVYDAPPPAGAWAGVALAVKLRGGDRWYTSHHDVPDWSIQRDDPAATTVELPSGVSPADVEAIKAIAVPVGAPGPYRITVSALNRGFLLGPDHLPGASFVQWRGAVTLTPEQPEAEIWRPPY